MLIVENIETAVINNHLIVTDEIKFFSQSQHAELYIISVRVSDSVHRHRLFGCIPVPVSIIEHSLRASHNLIGIVYGVHIIENGIAVFLVVATDCDTEFRELVVGERLIRRDGKFCFHIERCRINIFEISVLVADAVLFYIGVLRTVVVRKVITVIGGKSRSGNTTEIFAVHDNMGRTVRGIAVRIFFEFADSRTSGILSENDDFSDGQIFCPLSRLYSNRNRFHGHFIKFCDSGSAGTHE